MSYKCQKCPRTFKLEEYFLKHQKVHFLKKQNVCKDCGFVYGAAKGLKTHQETVHKNAYLEKLSNLKHCQNLPFSLKNNFFNDKDIYETVNFLKNEKKKCSLLSDAAFAQSLTTRTACLSELSLVPLSINPETSSTNISPSSKPRTLEDKSKIPSPAGTGSYKIYGNLS